MPKVTVYQKPTCSTCQHTVQMLKDAGVDLTTVNYYETPFTADQLKALLRQAGLSPREVLRTKEDLYQELGLADQTLGDDELIAAMVAHPDLIQRPLVKKGDQVLLARPAERVQTLLS